VVLRSFFFDVLLFSFLGKAGGESVQLEFHQLELRYERLRVVRPEPERRLLASLAEVGQQVPIVVVKDQDPDRYVVIDGYKRIRSLRKLARDAVLASRWPGEEAEALIVTRLMQTAETETVLEQSWLLLELKQRFGFSLEELARRFGHSVSWVSRRLALVQELPDSIQHRVQRGEIVAHGAAKYLVPLARANRQACLELVEAIGSTRLTSSDLGILYRAYQTGNWVTRQRLLDAPLVFLKSHKQTQTAATPVEPGPGDNLLSDLEVLSSAARRADRRLRQGVLRNLADPQRQELARCLDQSLHETQRLAERFHQELGDVGSEHASRDSEAPATGS
jgi:ParB family chromosome partitioning protein